MNFIPIDTESFDIITKLWEGRSESDIAKLIDQRFIPLIKKINADPDMKTMFCCSGHIRGEKGYAMLNAKEIHCITLSERQITNATFGSLNGHTVNLEVDS